MYTDQQLVKLFQKRNSFFSFGPVLAHAQEKKKVCLFIVDSLIYAEKKYKIVGEGTLSLLYDIKKKIQAGETTYELPTFTNKVKVGKTFQVFHLKYHNYYINKLIDFMDNIEKEGSRIRDTLDMIVSDIYHEKIKGIHIDYDDYDIEYLYNDISHETEQEFNSIFMSIFA